MALRRGTMIKLYVHISTKKKKKNTCFTYKNQMEGKKNVFYRSVQKPMSSSPITLTALQKPFRLLRKPSLIFYPALPDSLRLKCSIFYSVVLLTPDGLLLLLHETHVRFFTLRRFLFSIFFFFLNIRDFLYTVVAVSTV